MVNRLRLVNALRAVFVIVHQQSPIAINHAAGILTFHLRLRRIVIVIVVVRAASSTPLGR